MILRVFFWGLTPPIQIYITMVILTPFSQPSGYIQVPAPDQSTQQVVLNMPAAVCAAVRFLKLKAMKNTFSQNSFYKSTYNFI